jgi:FkbM family methyltransferase
MQTDKLPNGRMQWFRRKPPTAIAQDDGFKRPLIFGRQAVLAGSGAYFRNMTDGPLVEQAIDCCAAYVPENAICVDIGANIGVMAIALAWIAKRGHVVAVEPNARTVEFLRANVVPNASCNVEVVQRLVGTSGSHRLFMANSTDSGWSTSLDAALSPECPGYEAQGLMECASVDDLVRETDLPRVDFIKIDCEGGELEVLAGAQETLRRFTPTVMLEFNAHCLMNFARINPPDALDQIMAMFPFVSRVHTDGILEPIVNRFAFMHFHVTQRTCVDDLLCSFSPPRRLNP